MISNIETMRKAFKGNNPQFSGVILYDGPSQIDGKPIIAVACRIAVASGNEKTGAMVQTFIMRKDIAPHEALKTGDDSSVCGDCALRPINKGETRCYVRVYQAPLSVYNAFHRGRYAVPGVDFDPALTPFIFEGLAFRLGSYGDPAAVPAKVWRVAAKLVRSHTGYTHQWRKRIAAGLKNLCMASADHADDVKIAEIMGWRTFRVRKHDAPTLKNEAICPASKEGGQRTTCANCGLCKASSIMAKHIVIADHGVTDKRRHAVNA